MKIAPDGGDGIRAGSRQEMIQRFFLNGVHMKSDGIAVNMGHQLSGPVFPDPAKTKFGRLNPAPVPAKMTVNYMVLFSPVKEGLFKSVLYFGFQMKFPL